MKDTHTYGKKMARNGRTKVIYKGTFICKQTLPKNICTHQKVNKVSAYTKNQFISEIKNLQKVNVH